MTSDPVSPTPLPVPDSAESDDLLAELERRALLGLSEDDEDIEIDIAARLKGEGEVPADIGDVTLGGYIEKHDRVPAFEGCDGQPYTVDVDVEEGDGEEPFAAFLVFIRWAETGAGIMDHTESGTIATGRSAGDVRQRALDLSLYDVRAELDAAIERKRRNMED